VEDATLKDVGGGALRDDDTAADDDDDTAGADIRVDDDSRVVVPTPCLPPIRSQSVVLIEDLEQREQEWEERVVPEPDCS
jgi:hypothetical protein